MYLLRVGSGLSANISLGRTGFPVTNTLAYYKHLLFTAVKSFITFDPGHFGVKLLFSVLAKPF